MISKDVLKDIPSTSGVYFFYKKNIPLYIGKAINLRARLISHLRNSQFDQKEKLIIDQSDRIECTKTISEFDALILEANMIRRYKPQYNIVLKDDKSHLYIKITKETYPKVSLVRRENDYKSLYFGPFSSFRVTRSLIHAIRRIIPFCMQSRIGKTRCFYAKIGLCDPCPGDIERETDMKEKVRIKKTYLHNISLLKKILSGRSQLLLTDFERDLAQATKSEEYEKALDIRDKITHLNNLIYKRSFSNPYEVKNISLAQITHSIQEFMKKNFPNGTEKVGPHFRIECFDISNLFGKEATASMVVYENGGLEKEQYRRFEIKTVKVISDFAMIEEVLRRRFKKTGWRFPNLLVIDGGSPQVRIAQKTLLKLDISIPVIGIAKKPDRLLRSGEKISPAPIDRNGPFFKIIHELRDESHRFAKKYHLLLRGRKIGV